MDAWIDELMWSGVEAPLPPKDNATTQSGSTSSSGVQSVACGDAVVAVPQYQQTQMPGTGGDQQYNMQMPVNPGGHGNSHQRQDALAIAPTVVPQYSSFPCIGSYAVNTNRFQSSANAHVGLLNTTLMRNMDSSRNALVPHGHVAGGFAYPPAPTQLLAVGGGSFTGAPTATCLGSKSIHDANYGYVYQKQSLASSPYHYFTDDMAGFQTQQAPGSNAGANDHVWPNLRGADDDWSVPVGYASMDVAAGSSLFYTPAASSDSFANGGAPAGAIGTACNNFEETNGFEYETQCLLSDGDVQCPDATSHCSGLEQQLNHYLSDMAERFLFRT